MKVRTSRRITSASQRQYLECECGHKETVTVAADAIWRRKKSVVRNNKSRCKGSGNVKR